ncbi:hypothetical protein DM872_08015 [Pseudomonas taiwanensis]|uniref:hypothetical protein n=1 Tax=Pseudomonas taiwanensis TaxID=470150 RepID=UPI0015B85886|nr:hypothetical protein [Pseudomonas taiwanensis]NWL76790.1 hypothetical protein [Pseudomonas taiwanensis]
MSKHSKHFPNSGAATAINPARNPGQTNRSPTSIKPERPVDPKAMPREEARRALPQDTEKVPAKGTVKEPPRAAKGDDDLMSQEPKKT